LVALDWGTTSLRAYLLDGAGRIIDRLARPSGIQQVPNGDFEAVFEAVAGPWLDAHGNLPILASGMIGSRQGWREAAYVPCPAGAADLNGNLCEVTTRRRGPVLIVPGISWVDAAGVPDVIRGEETQILGAMVEEDPESGNQNQNTSRAVFVLPGTHSKWALVENGRIIRFSTYMTGELFSVLCKHSILGRLMTGETLDMAAFRRGLDLAGTDSLLHQMFSARTLGLFGQIPGEGLHSYLSGLLIGTEITEAIRSFGIGALAVTVIGGAELADLYVEALSHEGVPAQLGPEHAVVNGLWRIAEMKT